MQTFNVGFLGGGNVAGATLQRLTSLEARFAALGVRLRVQGVLVRDLSKKRAVPAETPLTTDPNFVPECDVLIELMGGTERALELLGPHLAAGKPVVTANKALLAERWGALRGYAERGLLHYEASVMAGTPVLAPLATTLRGSHIFALRAVLNATCTFILSRIESGEGYGEALAVAQRLGYAEEDPTLDVSGLDAAQKLVVLARLVANPGFEVRDVQVQGIAGIDEREVRAAVSAGERYKLVGELARQGDAWTARVAPIRLPVTHPFCAPSAGRNALWLQGEGCGELLFTGGSAGAMVTASAVVGDLFNVVSGVPGQRPLPVS